MPRVAVVAHARKSFGGGLRVALVADAQFAAMFAAAGAVALHR